MKDTYFGDTHPQVIYDLGVVLMLAEDGLGIDHESEAGQTLHKLCYECWVRQPCEDE